MKDALKSSPIKSKENEISRNKKEANHIKKNEAVRNKKRKLTKKESDVCFVIMKKLISIAQTLMSVFTSSFISLEVTHHLENSH